MGTGDKHLDVGTLSAIAEGRSDPAGEAHLAQCARCRTELKFLRQALGHSDLADAADHAAEEEPATIITDMASLEPDPLGATMIDTDSLAQQSVQETLSGFVLDRALPAFGDELVYQARHPQTGEAVVLKVMPKGLSDSDRRRLEAFASVGGDILARLDLRGLSTDPPHYCAPLCTGTAVLEAAAGAAVAREEMLRWLTSTLGFSLLGLHEAGCAHGAIKPERVLVGPGRKVTLLEPLVGDEQVSGYVEDWLDLALLMVWFWSGVPPDRASLSGAIAGLSARGGPTDAFHALEVMAGQRDVPAPSEIRQALSRIRLPTLPSEPVPTDTAELEPRKRIGPYDITAELGKGGMGVVYEARHSESGQLVALKTVRTADGQLPATLRREVAALSTVDHPGVVTIVDHGVSDDGWPWYAMELLRGTTLNRYCNAVEQRSSRTGSATDSVDAEGETDEDWWTGSLEGVDVDAARNARNEMLRVTALVCDALAHLHAAGLVHRDMKPENILVGSDGQPVIVDFGLAQAHGGGGREKIDIDRGIAGTVAYMAPEQSGEDLIDSRADIYAMGCILFELMAGRPPFIGPMRKVLVEHRAAAPPRLSELVAEIDPAVEELVAQMLTKEPPDRIAQASDVAARIRRILELPPPPERPPPVLFRPRLSGRSTALEELGRLAAALSKSHGSFHLVTGESGVGKSRVVMEFARRVQVPRLRLVTASCQPMAQQDALSALNAAIDRVVDHCRNGGPDVVEQMLGSHGTLLALYFESVANLLDVKADTIEPEAALVKNQVANALTHVFVAQTETRPLLVVIDDLQWADELLLNWLLDLVRGDALDNTPLAVVATCRVETISGDLARLRDHPNVHNVDIGRLDVSALSQMIADVLAWPDPPYELVRFVADQTDGNPFYVAEYLRLAVESGRLSRRPDGTWQATDNRWASLPTPQSIRELVRARFADLSEGALRTAQVAAVIGSRIDAAMLEYLADTDPSELGRSVVELVQRQILESDGHHLRFVHDKVREGAYEEIGEGDRVRWHRRAAHYLESDAAAAAGSPVAALAMHWDAAGDKNRAWSYHRLAGDHALARFAAQRAEVHYRRHLELTEVVSFVTIEVKARMAKEVLALTGRTAEAISLLESALEDAHTIGDQRGEGIARRHLGLLLSRTGEKQRAREHLEAAYNIFVAQKDRRHEGMTRGHLGSEALASGRLDEAETHFEGALKINREVGDHKNAGQSLNALALVAKAKGDLSRAKVLHEQALSLYRRYRFRDVEGVVLNNLAIIELAEGRRAQAKRLLSEAIEIHREVGNRRSEAISLLNVGDLQRQDDEYEEAKRNLERGLAICREGSLRGLESAGLQLLGVVYIDSGRYSDASEVLTRALQVAMSTGSTERQCMALGNLARLERYRARNQRAAELADKAIRLAHKHGYRTELPGLLCERGHIELANNGTVADFLAQAREAAKSITADHEPTIVALRNLEQAVQMNERGGRNSLVFGQLAADLPSGVRDALLKP